MSSKGKGKGKVRSSSTPPGPPPEESRPARRAASPAATKGRDGDKGQGKGKASGKGRQRSTSPPVRGRPAKGESKGKGSTKRSSSAPPRATSDWDNPDGWALDDLAEGTVLEGVVTNTGPAGVFIDVGAERNGRLNAPVRDQRKFKRGDRISGLTVDAVDVTLRRMSLSIEDAEAAASQHRKELQDFAEGDTVDGIVVNKSPAGLFINIGGVKDGRLSAPIRICRQFVRGQVVRGLLIDSINLEKQWITLSHPEPEAAAADLTFVSLKNGIAAPAAAGKGGKSKSKAKAKSKSSSKPEITEESVGLKVGSFCDGVVTNVTQRDIIVELDGKEEYQGILKVSAELREQFQTGDHVQGMKVEKVGPKSIVLSMEDPELEVEEEARIAAAAAAAKAKGGKGGKGKSKGKSVKG